MEPTDKASGALSALVASRICHDIVNPLGAVANGIELLELSGGGGEELALARDAAAQAVARVEILRIAFGAAEPGQTLGLRALRRSLDEFSKSGRINWVWTGEADPARIDAKRALLAMLCVERTLPKGGTIRTDGAQATGEGPELALDPALWEPLCAGRTPESLTSAQVQFAALAAELAVAGRPLSLEHDATRLTLRF